LTTMRRRSRTPSLATLVAAIGLLALALPASASASLEFFVDDDEVYGPSGCDGTGLPAFDTIQEAVEAALLPNSKIRVCPGTYTGQVVVNADDPDGLVIRALDPWTATLTPPADHLDTAPLVSIVGVEDTKVVGLNIEVPTSGTCGQVGEAFSVSGSTHTILRSNHIRAIGTETLGDCGYTFGISVFNSPDSLIAWNRVIDFTYKGINVVQSSGVRVRGNTVRFNHIAEEAGDHDGRGIEFGDSPQGQILGNVVGSLTTADDTTPILDSGIFVFSSNETRVKDNNVFRVIRGIDIESASTVTVSGNRIRYAQDFGIGLLFSAQDGTVENNSAKLGDDRGITVEGSTGNEIVGNDFRNNGGTDCVDSSGPPGNTWTNNLGAESDPAGLCGTP
jgi:parallel beta-helix repeat protein